MEKLFILPRRRKNAPENQIHLGSCNSVAPLRRTIFPSMFSKGEREWEWDWDRESELECKWGRGGLG